MLRPDKQGSSRIRVNPLDALITLLILTVIIFGTTHIQRFRTPQRPISQWDARDAIELSCIFYWSDMHRDWLTAETAHLVRSGDKERDSVGRTLVEVLEVGSVRPVTLQAKLSSDIAITVIPGTPAVELPVILRLHGYLQPEDNQFRFKQLRVQSGSRIQMRTDRYALSGKALLDPADAS